MLVSLGVVLTLFFRATLSGSGNCPSVCVCKWKGGKQTVECTDRALIMVPEGVDSETQVLDMSGNNLQTLPRENFVRTGLLNLQRLYLRNCRLGLIDDKALRGLTNLVELDLSSNLLTSIPSATFQDVPFLRDLTLANNPIQKIESHAFKTVPGLVKLDLSHCALQTISPKAFEGVELLESLKLNGNKLREIRPQTVDTLSRLHGVELHDNPWYCDCHLRAAKLWLTDNNIPYPIAPMCSGGPDRIARRSFSDLDIDDFACKPEIKLDSRHVEATAGDNATVVCRVESVPEASISWYWNGRLLLNNSAFSSFQRVFIIETGGFEKRSTLIVTNAQESDSGDFYCIAENRAGNAEANYTVHISYRMAGMASLGSGQIAGLSAALVVLILFILLVILVLLVRLRRTPFAETKTPAQVEVLANGTAVQKPSTPVTIETSTFVERKEPLQKAVVTSGGIVRTMDSTLSFGGVELSGVGGGGGGGMLSSGSDSFAAPASDPDLINDTREEGSVRPGEYTTVREAALLYTGDCCWEADGGDRTPIVDHIAEGYPPDYGLPIPAGVVAPQPSAKTLRVWQRGVPVLPPVNALKRVLSRNSPDEGYQEGCGTDV